MIDIVDMGFESKFTTNDDTKVTYIVCEGYGSWVDCVLVGRGAIPRCFDGSLEIFLGLIVIAIFHSITPTCQ